ncbi:hypothetical protein Metev_0659 [Methanohalobium evestigatum Z-7303]|uniref:Uncharacterized protein n=1 Tax=Methanohalobium evestigatum (strain ATCC BAA-1072 / DSM 3721 / NBRC 107634 / OCM 161 / Z-7303) TaxID=644295 RepID=D7E6U1_METEZ|nr:hypothetical protein [Methanohalobium evestigatum]ADI73565.1 hypothetical protein Metev_0659 [Methanohalobium evestigatum Z-7303]
MAGEVQQNQSQSTNLDSISKESRKIASQICSDDKDTLDYLEQFGNEFDRNLARTIKLVAGVE